MKTADPRKFVPLLCAFVLLICPFGEARTWTSTDGRTVEGDFVSATATAVTVKLASGKTVPIELTKLSQDDRDFVAEQAKSPSTKPVPAKPGPAVTKAPGAIAGPYAANITGEWNEIEGKGGLKCMFFAGKTLDASKKYPLLVYLHGKGNNVLNKSALAFAASCAKPDNYEKNPCFILAPQCPDENGWAAATGVSLLKAIKDLQKNLPIDDNRVYLAGHSMGGFGTFYLLNEQPRMFAAGIPVSGGVAEGASHNLRKMPLWIFHGEKDYVVKPDMDRAIAKILEKFHAPCKYTEYPGEGHGIIGKVSDDPEVHKWLFEQKRK